MTLFAALCATTDARPDHRGEVAIACPECGKPPKRGQTHFSFSQRGGYCFCCGHRTSLAGLAKRLELGDIAPIALPPPRPRTPRPWQSEPEKYVARYVSALDRVSAWTAYRPLTLDTIARWQLGVGRLPSSKCAHRRLVVPIRRDGKVVALAGRAFCCPPTCEAARWTLAGGSEFALFGLDGVGEGSTVIVVENRADAVLACQEWPDYVTVAKGSANVWKPEWTEAFIARRPALVRFWPDNDEAGYAGAARGANELLDAGLRADVVRWAASYPAKYDLGSFLGDLMVEERIA